jgi:acetyl esterase/lipase
MSINTNGLSTASIITQAEALTNSSANKKSSFVQDGLLSLDDASTALDVLNQKGSNGSLSTADKKLQTALQSMVSHPSIFTSAGGSKGVNWGTAKQMDLSIQKFDSNDQDPGTTVSSDPETSTPSPITWNPQTNTGGTGKLTPANGVTEQKNLGNMSASEGYDLYTPKNATSKTPVVVLIHGGSWVAGNKGTLDEQAKSLAAQGMIVATVDYKLLSQTGNNFGAVMQSGANAAASVIRSVNAGENGVPAGEHPYFMMGHSAGGQMAGLISTNPQLLANAGVTQKPAGLIGLAGVYDWNEANDPKDNASTYVNQNSPPSLLVAGSADETINPDQATKLAKKETQAGVSSQTMILPGVSHNGVLDGLTQADSQLMNGITSFVGANS